MSAPYPPFARPGDRLTRGPRDELPPISRFLDELPSIADFLDELQPIEDFIGDEVAEPTLLANELPSIDQFTESNSEWDRKSEAGSDEWVMDDWNSYDWSRLSSLGRQSAEAVAADNDWNATEWVSEPVEQVQGYEQFDANHEPSPHEVATALDEIARRIRAGELTIEQFHGSPPEAAMAAALAALLRMRG